MKENKISDYDLLVVTGPTASGKTSLAALVAKKLNGEIISADSRQVYREMNIGTGKDYNDYLVEAYRVPCHLIDIADPGYKYNLFEFQSDFQKVYNELKQRNIFPVVCGGSGMYIDSIVSGYLLQEVPSDPELRSTLEKKSLSELAEILSGFRRLHNKTDLDTKKRVIRAIEIEQYNLSGKEKFIGMPDIRSLITGIFYDRLNRRGRITERLKQRLDSGMVDEVRQLMGKGLAPESLIYYGLEYKYITMFLLERITYNEMFTQLETAIHRFAKRQMTWFRGMERRGIKIHWIDGELPLEEKAERVLNLLYKS